MDATTIIRDASYDLAITLYFICWGFGIGLALNIFITIWLIRKWQMAETNLNNWRSGAGPRLRSQREYIANLSQYIKEIVPGGWDTYCTWSLRKSIGTLPDEPILLTDQTLPDVHPDDPWSAADLGATKRVNTPAVPPEEMREKLTQLLKEFRPGTRLSAGQIGSARSSW